LAQPSNDGIHSQNVFAFLPELELYLHYQLTNQIDLSVGYTFLMITRVARVGDQLDTNVSSTTLPTANPTSGIGNQPTETLRDTSLWAQGISGGIELRF
jgi:putative beta barrel porin BBP7